jgi:hypothetical protein
MSRRPVVLSATSRILSAPFQRRCGPSSTTSSRTTELFVWVGVEAHDIDPLVRLADVLARIADTAITRLGPMSRADRDTRRSVVSSVSERSTAKNFVFVL